MAAGSGRAAVSGRKATASWLGGASGESAAEGGGANPRLQGGGANPGGSAWLAEWAHYVSVLSIAALYCVGKNLRSNF